jgi:hypothetical protein
VPGQAASQALTLVLTFAVCGEKQPITRWVFGITTGQAMSARGVGDGGAFVCDSELAHTCVCIYPCLAHPNSHILVYPTAQRS